MRRFIFFLLCFFIISIGIGQQIPKGYCLVHLEIQRSNETPLKNESLTFWEQGQKQNLGISTVTDSRGKCSVLLRKKAKYNILFLDYEYTKMLPVSSQNEMNYPIPIMIDEGLFATIKFEYKNYENKPAPNEWVKCTNNSTGESDEAYTGEDGIAYFYIPRGFEYSFDITTTLQIRTFAVKVAKGYASYEVRVPIKAQSTEEYKQEMVEYERIEKEMAAYHKHNDSIIDITPVNVFLFFNNESGEDFPMFKVYDSKKKLHCLGQINTAWESSGMCAANSKLCLGSFKNIPDEWKAYLTVKLTRGKHTLYIESLDGTIKKEVVVEVLVYTNVDHLDTYKVSARICY